MIEIGGFGALSAIAAHSFPFPLSSQLNTRRLAACWQTHWAWTRYSKVRSRLGRELALRSLGWVMSSAISSRRPTAPNPVVGKPPGHRSQILKALQGERSRLTRQHKAYEFGDQIEPV